VVRDRDDFPTATVISAVIRSWVWDVVEEICGAHQDAKVVASAVPFSIWIPLQKIVPCVNSGLGFVVPGPDRLLPTLPHDDDGSEYVLSDLARLWILPYEVGDITIHSRFSPHFTTGYGTLSNRFSFEIRAMPGNAAPQNYLDPAIYVSRRNGVPTIVETRSSAKIGPRDFFDSRGLSCATSGELRKVLL
jgi:hypothetical protein